jgi:hypothetical protein
MRAWAGKGTSQQIPAPVPALISYRRLVRTATGKQRTGRQWSEYLWREPSTSTARRNTRDGQPTSEHLLMRQNQEYLEDFIAAMNQFLKRPAEFQAEHPDYGDRYSRSSGI